MEPTTVEGPEEGANSGRDSRDLRDKVQENEKDRKEIFGRNNCK